MGANLAEIREAFCRRTYILTTTGTMKLLKRDIAAEQVEDAICGDAPEIIEDYPEDERGPACLVLGWADLARPLHVEVGYGLTPGAVIALITAYEPDASKWYPDLRTRRR